MERPSRNVEIQGKSYTLDVKESSKTNSNFLRIKENTETGRRTQLYFSLAGGIELREKLTAFHDFFLGLAPLDPENLPTEKTTLKTDVIVRDSRRYYLDFNEGSRGRILRITQTVARNGPRYSITVSGEGIQELGNAVGDILADIENADIPSSDDELPLPEARHLRADNKMFHFDVGKNQRGTFMRISEVNSSFRNSVTIPVQVWSKFRDIIGEYVDKTGRGGSSGTGSGGSTSHSGDESGTPEESGTSPSPVVVS